MNIPQEAMNKTIYVGKVKNPKGFIKRSEVLDYLDDEFYRMKKIWDMFHLGFGLPGGRSWDKQPKHIMKIIETFEIEYKEMQGA